MIYYTMFDNTLEIFLSQCIHEQRKVAIITSYQYLAVANLFVFYTKTDLSEGGGDLDKVQIYVTSFMNSPLAACPDLDWACFICL